jgi:hypothetical protein
VIGACEGDHDDHSDARLASSSGNTITFGVSLALFCRADEATRDGARRLHGISRDADSIFASFEMAMATGTLRTFIQRSTSRST